MPRRAVAVLALVVAGLGGCRPTLPSGPAVSQPSPVIASPSPPFAWVENLTISGEVTDQINTIAPDQTGAHSGCTAGDSRVQGVWRSAFYFLIGADTWELVVSVTQGYQGPGPYPAAKVQVYDPTGTRAWQTEPGDPTAFIVAVGEQAGTIDSTATNLADLTGKIHVAGTWTCSP